MDLTELYTAMVEEEADYLARDRRERQARRLPPVQSPQNIAQAARLRALEQENRLLRKGLADLADVMARKGSILPRDIQEIMAATNPANPSRHHRAPVRVDA